MQDAGRVQGSKTLRLVIDSMGICIAKKTKVEKEDGKMEQNQTVTRMPLIGDDAPAFEAVTTQGTIHFPEDYRGKWVILFSPPADFTPVCTT